MKWNFDDLKGRNAVITGGFGVLGMALTRGLLEAGVNLSIIGRSKENAQRAAALQEEFPEVKVLGLSASVLARTALEEVLLEIHQKMGKIDILINCAGGNSPKATCAVEQLERIEDLGNSFYGLGLDGFEDVFDLNFIGTVLPTMIFSRDMVENRKGVVLNISSMNSIRPLTKIPAYSSAKASINNFTEWFAVHVAPMGVRCNAIAPGFFLTNQNRFLLTDEKTGELKARGRKIIASTPTHKFGEPEDLVGTMLYLLSDISSFVTGIVIPVDGGYSAFGGV